MNSPSLKSQQDTQPQLDRSYEEKLKYEHIEERHLKAQTYEGMHVALADSRLENSLLRAELVALHSRIDGVLRRFREVDGEFEKPFNC